MIPHLIFGPPGSGKTSSLLDHVDSKILADIAPDTIGFMSFTRKAANEAVDRAMVKFKLEREDFPHFRTLHSLCYAMLNLKKGDVFEGEATREFAKWAGVRITGKWTEDGSWQGFDTGDRMLFMDNLARVRGIPLRQQWMEDPDQLVWSQVDRFSRALAEFKKYEGLLDYTDMLKQYLMTRRKPKLKVLMIDECQDLSNLQWQVVHKLSEECEHVLYAGDDDQAIYRWAGADSDHMLTMECTTEVLGQSWRVPKRIQDMARNIIERVKRRKSKEWRPREGGEGVIDRVSQLDRANLDGKDVLILARNVYIIKEQIEPVLRREGIIYEKAQGWVSIKENMLESIRAWERLRKGLAVSIEIARNVYKFMSMGTGVARNHKTLTMFKDKDEVTLADLKNRGGLLREDVWYDALDRIPMSDKNYLRSALRRGEKPTQRPRVRVSTIHSEKGGQADHVILFEEMAKRTHEEMQRNSEDERRVWYVAVSRAKEQLTIVKGTTPQRCPWL